jgi:hypothetical protein
VPAESDIPAAMLDTRRIEIECFPGFEVDARCRVFVAGTYDPLSCQWPYVTLKTGTFEFSLKAPEVCALAFLGPDGCEAVFRELYMHNVGKGHPRVKEIALERGISQWAVIEAARKPPGKFRASSILEQLRSGHFGPSMWLHRIDSGMIHQYETFPVEGWRTVNERIYDHVLTVAGVKYRIRRNDTFPLARIGDRVSFAFRKDIQGGIFIVGSSFVRTDLTSEA